MGKKDLQKGAEKLSARDIALLRQALGVLTGQGGEANGKQSESRSRRKVNPTPPEFVDPPPAGTMNTRLDAPSGCSHYIVQDARLRMLSWGAFRRVAVLEVDADKTRVSSISSRAAGCRRVIAVWERRYVGDGNGTAYGQALAEARNVADVLNFGVSMALVLAKCKADCILPTADELNASRNWRTGTLQWIDWGTPERLSAEEIRARIAVKPVEACLPPEAQRVIDGMRVRLKAEGLNPPPPRPTRQDSPVMQKIKQVATRLGAGRPRAANQRLRRF